MTRAQSQHGTGLLRGSLSGRLGVAFEMVQAALLSLDNFASVIDYESVSILSRVCVCAIRVGNTGIRYTCFPAMSLYWLVVVPFQLGFFRLAVISSFLADRQNSILGEIDKT